MALAARYVDAMIIPHRQLSPEALQGLIEDFVTRDWTDYGESGASLETKVAQVRRQLNDGSAVIVFDSEAGGVAIVPRNQLPDIL